MSGEDRSPGHVRIGTLMTALLWVAWATLLGWSLVDPGSGFAMLLRVCSSSALVLAACRFAATSGRSGTADVSMWIAAGMTLGFLGDAWALVPEEQLPVHRLIPAMVLFGLGHAAYITGFVRASRSRPIPPWQAAWLWALWLAVAAVAWYASIHLSQAPPLLLWSALAYTAILGGTTAAGWVLAAGQRDYVPVALGCVLFLISDFVLAIQSFRGSFPHATELCWATYGPGQMLIVYGMAWGEGLVRSTETPNEQLQSPRSR
ncbi:MAG: lysoplasmalogenase [Isosphaeraceae bacterium]